MDNIYFTEFNTQLGAMLIAGNSRGLTRVSFCKHPRALWINSDWIRDSIRFRREIQSIKSYLQGKIDALESLKWKMGNVGTSFQRAVWRKIRNIPPGETLTYGEVASSLGHPGAARAVGGACKANPFSLLIPCHRVVGSNKRLTGYYWGLKKKSFLLKLENPDS